MKEFYSESVMSRVVRIIDSFDRSARALRLTDLADRTGIPLPTTHRLVAEMLSLGLLERGPNRTIKLGNRLWEIALKGSGLLSLREAAQPHLEWLMKSLRVHVNLSVLDNYSVLFLERLQYGEPSTTGRTSERWAIHDSSSGLVMLAFAPPKYQEFILSRPLAQRSAETIVDPVQLRKLLPGIRRSRIAYVPGVGLEGYTGLATPILGAGGDVIASVSVIYPRGTEQPAAATEALLISAHRIHMALISASNE